MDDMDACVARGAALLDEKYEGWHERIDQSRLRMESVHDCVLGQLYGGGYAEGLRDLFPNSDWPSGSEHGFDTAGEYAELADLWREQIEQRQS